MEYDQKVKQEHQMDRDGSAASDLVYDKSSTTSTSATIKVEDPSSSGSSTSNRIKTELRGGLGDQELPLPAQAGSSAAHTLSPDGSRSSSGSEEAQPDRTHTRNTRALPLEKVDVGGLSLHSVPPDEPAPDAPERPTRLRRTVTARQPALGAMSEDSYDDYSSSEEEEMRKTIMIGSAYQAVVPEGFSKYNTERPYKHADKLLWEPRGVLDNEVIEQYLQTSNELTESSAVGIDVLPMGSHTRDDEQALFLLMQSNHNVEEALRRRRATPPAASNPSAPWTDEECRNFENGILTFGKDFHTIQAQRLRTRTVSEIVQFYYLWKKTERHDVFANKMRPDKKKYMLHPGVTLVVYELLEKENQKDASSKDSVTA